MRRRGTASSRWRRACTRWSWRSSRPSGASWTGRTALTRRDVSARSTRAGDTASSPSAVSSCRDATLGKWPGWQSRLSPRWESTATWPTGGQGEAREVTVVAEGGMAERAVVSIRPATGQVRVSAETECAPGSAHDLATEVFAEERLPDDVWRRPRRLARKRGFGGGGIRILWRVDGGGSRGQSCPISASRCRRGMSGWGHGQ